MKRAHDLAEALQIVVKRRRRIALCVRGQAETKQYGTDGEKSFHAIAQDPRGDGMRRLDGNRKADHRVTSSVAAAVTISAKPSVEQWGPSSGGSGPVEWAESSLRPALS